ncbi:MAG: hypothetical protein ABI968_11155, partial [Acidobacteriota bacterium]
MKSLTLTLARDGWHTVTPRIVTHDAKDRPSEVRIGDSMVMISDAGERKPMTAFLYVYVHDTDA